MKKLFFFICFSILVHYSHAVSSLLAYYPLTSNGVDVTGLNDTIYRQNAPFQGGGIYCNGNYSGMQMRTPQINGFNFNSFTISFDFNADEYNTRPVIICGTSYRWLGLYLDTNGFVKVKYNNSNFATTAFNYTPHHWHSAHFTYDGTTVRFFMDGVEAFALAVALVYITSDTQIGAKDYSNGKAFKGLIRNLKITSSPDPQYFNYNTTGDANSFPFNIVGGKQVQLLYLPGDFNQPTPAPAGNISSISFRINNSYALGPWTYTDFTIKMGQSNDTSFATGGFYTGSLTTVYYRASVTLTGTAGGWMTITLDNPFYYDPTRSLIVDIGQCGVTGATGFSACYTALAYNRRNYSAGGCPFAYTGQNNSVYHIGLFINCAVPSAPVNLTTLADRSICYRYTATLTARGMGTLGWYDSPTGGTYLGGGPIFNTPVLTSTTTYYVQDSTCDVSPTRTPITVVVYPPVLPNIYATPPLSVESFENGGAVPSGWDVETISGSNTITFVTSTSWPSGFSAFDGSYLIKFNSWYVSGGVMRVKKTIPFSTIGMESVSVNFEWLESAGYIANNDRVTVEWSTDGTTWNTAGIFNRYNEVEGWKEKSQALPSGALDQANLYIAFKFTSEYGNDCYLDYVRIVTVASEKCSGSSETYMTQAGMSNYTWDVSTGGTITAGGGTADNSVTVVWNTQGSQHISVRYTDDDGCNPFSPFVRNVMVRPLPLPVISGPSSSCKGSDNVIYTTDAGMTAYSWSISSGGTITAGTGTDQVVVSWSDNGLQHIFVNYQDLYGCTAAGPTAYNVNVNDIPSTPVIFLNHDTLFSNAFSGNQWYSIAAGPIPGAVGPWYIPQANGTYFDIVTLNSCSSDTSNLITVNNVSVPDLSWQNGFMVYPNPTGDYLFIEQASAVKAEIEMLDISGKQVYKGEIMNVLNKVVISNLPAGIYTLKINSKRIIKAVKIYKM